MAAYRPVDDWLPVHRDQLQAQHSVSSMGSLYLLPMAVAWSSSDDSAVCCVLLVLCTISCFHILNFWFSRLCSLQEILPLYSSSDARTLLSEDMAGSIVTGMVLSHLDCANSLLFGCSASNLQHVWCTAAPVVSDTVHAIPSSLHWLPVHFHIEYKVVILTCRVMAHNQPLYLSHLLTPYILAHSVRSQDKRARTFCSHKQTRLQLRSAWDKIFVEIHNSPCFDSFKKHLLCRLSILSLLLVAAGLWHF